MTRYFAIIGAMRTGSNLLEQTLHALGDTACHGEVFNPAFVGGPRKTQVLGWDRARRDADEMGFLEALITAEPLLIPGFRIFNGHSPAVLDRVLTDPDCARIVLRRDPLDSYVSLQIARRTDQWMLRKPKRRIAARMTFDGAEYARYRAALAAHYDHVAARMAAAGTRALEVDYADLSDPDTIRRIIDHIGSAGRPPARAPILRQNPGHLSEKVSNYRAMCAALGREVEAPPAPRALLYLPGHAPLAFAPVAGPGVAPALAFLHRIEVRDFHQPMIPRGPLLDAVADGTACPRGEARDGRPVFTMVCHPVTRAFGLFADTVFGPEARTHAARLAVEEAVPALPAADAIGVGPSDPDLLRRAFDAFLEFLEHAVGQAPSLIPAWAAQSDLIDQWAETTGIDHVLQLDPFADAADALCAAVGLAPLPRGQQRAIRGIAGRPGSDPVGVLDGHACARIEALWPGDYDRFGYAPGPPVDAPERKKGAGPAGAP